MLDRLYFDEISLVANPASVSSSSVDPSQTGATSDNSGSSPDAGAIAGGVIGGLAFLAAIIGLFFLYKHKKKKSSGQFGGGEKSTFVGPVPIYVNYNDPVTSPHAASFPPSPAVTTPLSNAGTPGPWIPPPTPGSFFLGSAPPTYTSPAPYQPFNAPVLAPQPPITDDDIGRYAAAHRDVIPLTLENKLRDACFSPGDNPDDISPETWAARFGVEAFELKRLRQLYAR